ncbi:hypothetical protein HMPREF1860_00533 [Prevotella amnii]|uniref:Uncharacterized protein n=1 Tax=Prevotella amnii TaxID=419005 RepID=A0A134BIK7_9BACT|nr:hypothetical protein HMPREF1860_00533 [Prevotella amnii]
MLIVILYTNLLYNNQEYIYNYYLLTLIPCDKKKGILSSQTEYLVDKKVNQIKV